MRRPLHLVLACALLLAGCGSIRVERHAGGVTANPPHRIFVVYRIGPADHDIPVNFATALRINLADCRVEMDFVHREGLHFDDDPATRAELRASGADALLDIRLAQEVSFARYEGVFLFTLSSARTGIELWKALVRVLAGTPTGTNARVGTQLGTEIVRLMAADGVLRSCPPHPA